MNDNTAITFTNTLDDIIAFNMYHVRTSRVTRRMRFWATWGITVVLLGLALVLSLLSGSISSLIWMGAWAIFYLSYSLSTYNRRIRKATRRMYEEGKNKGVLGKHTIRIDEDGLHETSEVSEGKTLWSGIERIGEDENYLFVYVQAMMAHVIPKHRIDAGDLASFTEELRRHVSQP